MSESTSGGGAQSGGERNRITALVVDDSDRTAALLTAILEDSGCVRVVGRASDGAHGVAMCAELKPELVVMDLNMPGMNGLEATRQIKAAREAPLVLMVSLDDSPMDQVRAEQHGADAFCSKNRLHADFLDAVHALFPCRCGSVGEN